MKYEVVIEPRASRAIDQMASDVRVRVLRAIGSLGDDPRPHGYLKLTGFDQYRIRVGHFRVIYAIDDARVTVTVIRAGHRSSIY